LFDAKTFDADVAEFAATLARNSMVSMTGAKQLLHMMCASELTDDGAEQAGQIVASSFRSADYREGVRAFLERRPPRFGPEQA
jgi:enoyl-CoA hydratase